MEPACIKDRGVVTFSTSRAKTTRAGATSMLAVCHQDQKLTGWHEGRALTGSLSSEGYIPRVDFYDGSNPKAK